MSESGVITRATNLFSICELVCFIYSFNINSMNQAIYRLFENDALVLITRLEHISLYSCFAIDDLKKKLVIQFNA
jgi:hypothetical protein